MTAYSLLAIPIGYIIGSIPSSYIIGRLFGKVDMREAGDGRISAAAVYRKIGLIPYLLVVTIDIGKGTLAIIFAYLLTDSPILFGLRSAEIPVIVLLTGIFTVAGHSWSIFLKFKGGLGATAICGVLIGTMIFPLSIGLVTGLTFFLITRKSGLGTVIILAVTSIVLLVQNQPVILVLFPLALLFLMFLKRIQISRFSRSVA
jgi:glycerol-3-phosphate acyltransferase PlsY